MEKGRISSKYLVKAEIVAIEGRCPIYEIGDKIVIENDTINMRETKKICLPFLAGVMHKYQTYQFQGGTGPTLKCPMIGPPRGYGYVLYRYNTEPIKVGEVLK